MANPARTGRRLWPGVALAALLVVAATLVILLVGKQARTTLTPQQAAAVNRGVVAEANKAASQLAAQQRAAENARKLHVVRPSGRPLRVGFVGDSITVGAYASVKTHTYASLVTAGLRKDGPVAEGLDAVAGQTTAQADRLAVPRNADLVVVELGTNDAARATISHFADDYRRMLEKIVSASPHAAVLCAEPWWNRAKATAYVTVIDRECAAVAGKTVSINEHYSNLDYRTAKGASYYGGQAPDNFHPNDSGHAAIAAAVLGMLFVTKP